MVAKAHEFVAKINKLTPEKVRKNEERFFLQPEMIGWQEKAALFEILGPICLGVKSCVQV